MWKGLQAHVKTMQGGKARQGCTWYVLTLLSILAASDIAHTVGTQMLSKGVKSSARCFRTSILVTSRSIVLPLASRFVPIVLAASTSSSRIQLQATGIAQMLADQNMLIPANDFAMDGVSDSPKCFFYVSGTAAEGAVGLVR